MPDSTIRKYVVLRVHSDGSGWERVAVFDEPTLPLNAMAEGIVQERMLVAVSRAEWPADGNWSQLPTEPRLTEPTESKK